LTNHTAYDKVKQVMKLRTTTPVSKSKLSMRLKGISLFVIAGLMVLSVMPLTQPVSADEFDDKISSLTRDMARFQNEADRLNGEAATLQNAVAQIQNEKNALQSQIDLNQAKYDKLVVDIAQTEKEIKENQDALGDTIADLYVDNDISPLEMLASSTNIGDFMNRQEFRNSVKEQLNGTIKTVKTLKTQLDTQKVEVDKVLTDQKSARDTLAAKEAEQSNLLAQTQNDENNYQNLIKSSSAQIASAKAAQAAIRARSNATGGYQLVDAGSLAGYPWNNSNCRMQGYMSTGGVPGTDGEDGHGYGCRQCVSFVAYRVAQATGVYYNNLGNGGQTAQALVNRGWKNLGSTPEVGAVASLWGNPGHTAYVEAVSGGKVLVSQYNYDYGQGYGMYSEMWLSASFFNQYAKP